MTNPYEASQIAADAVEPESDLKTVAKARLSRPATALLIMASIHSVFPAITLVSFGFVWFGGMASVVTRPMIGFPIWLQLVQFVTLILISIGAAKMGHLESRRMAYVAAALACIPLVSPFVVLGIPFGAWALFQLGKPEVRAAFD